MKHMTSTQKATPSSRLLALCLTMLLCLSAHAEPVTLQQARQQALAFMRQHQMALPASPNRMPAYGPSATPATQPYYIFNAAHDEGFVIISGDDATTPVLGYVSQGTFDETSLPENVRAWLDYYRTAIDYLQRHPAAAPQRAASHAAISPMIQTQWDQDEPYNNLCPTYQGNRCYTGCVATAMAQVMNYHRWPQSATAAIPAYTTNRQMGILAALPSTTFDWAAMSSSSNSGFNTAVATLMEYCGHAVKMNYGTGGSGASSALIAPALRDYFGYDDDTRLATRSQYTIATWDALIYGELQAQRPVIYSGQSTGGGHEFVVDGYKDGLYHINWGWSGYCDGYYELSVLNPQSSDGIGASSSSDGYAMEQDAIVGVHPQDGTKTSQGMLPYTSAFYVEDSYLYINYENYTASSLTFDRGLKIKDSQGNISYQTIESITVDGYIISTPGVYAPYLLQSLSAGTYTIYPVVKMEGTDDWVQNAPDGLYIIVTKTAGGSLSYTMHEPTPGLSLASLTTSGDLQMGHVQDLVFTIQNTGDEFNGVLYLFMSTTDDKGASVTHTGTAIASGGSVDLHYYVTPNSVGTFHCWLSTNEDGTNAIGPRDINITTTQTADYDLRLYNDFSVQTSSTSFQVTFYVGNYGQDDYGRGIIYKIKEKDTGEEIGSGNSSSSIPQGSILGLTVSGSNYDPTKVYVFEIYYYKSPSATSPTLLASTDIIMPQASAITLPSAFRTPHSATYNLSGQQVSPTVPGLIIRGGKKYIHR